MAFFGFFLVFSRLFGFFLVSFFGFCFIIFLFSRTARNHSSFIDMGEDMGDLLFKLFFGVRELLRGDMILDKPLNTRRREPEGDDSVRDRAFEGLELLALSLGPGDIGCDVATLSFGPCGIFMGVLGGFAMNSGKSARANASTRDLGPVRSFSPPTHFGKIFRDITASSLWA